MNQDNIKAVIYNNNKPVRTMYNVKSVVPNNKYGYFEITQVFYRREIISIASYQICNKVEMYKHDENYYQYENKPFKVIERE